MANISSINSNPIVVGTSGISDGAVTEAKLDGSVQKLINEAGVSPAQLGMLEFEGGYILVGESVTTVNVENPTIVSPGGTTKHVIVECSLGDIFEIDLWGGSGARQFALIAGSDYETPYLILARSAYNLVEKRMHTYLVCINPNARYVIFQNKFEDAKNPGGYVRRVTREEYVHICHQADFDWLLANNYYPDYWIKTDGAPQQHANYNLSPFIAVRAGDVLEYQLTGNTSYLIGAVYDADTFEYVCPISAGDGAGNQTAATFTADRDYWVRLSYYYSYSNDHSHFQYAYKHLSIRPYSNHLPNDIYSNSYDAIEFLYDSRNAGDANAPVVTLLHFSDIHGAANRIRNIRQFVSNRLISDVLDDVICTGDIVTSNSANANPFDAAKDTSTLLTLGNHDVRVGSGAYKYNNFSIMDAYDKYFAGKIENWGVTTDPQAEYPTYYYKDYAAAKIRLIVLDANMDSANVPNEYARQLSWFAATMAEARTNGFNVVCAQHFPLQGTPNLIACNFTDLNSIAYTQIGDVNYNQSTIEAMQAAVQEHIDAGGSFVCWLAGHNHADFVFTVQEYPDQLCILVGTASTNVTSTLSDRTIGKAKNLFNCVTISPNEHQVKLIRFGADKTRWMVSKRAVCIDYQTKQVIAQA